MSNEETPFNKQARHRVAAKRRRSPSELPSIVLLFAERGPGEVDDLARLRDLQLQG
jgi:hypothetical protein